MMEEYKSLFGSVMANLGSRPDSAMNDFKTCSHGSAMWKVQWLNSFFNSPLSRT